MTSYLNNCHVKYLSLNSCNAIEKLQKILDGQSVTTYQIVTIQHLNNGTSEWCYIYYSGKME